MSTTLSRPIGIQQRSVEATRRLCAVLNVDNLKLLSTALAEVAAEEASRNRAFSERLHAVYDELVMLQTRRHPAKEANSSRRLVPITTIEDAKLDPHAPLDPNFLLRLYGAHQLRAALEDYSRDTLKVAAATIEQRNPGTKPTNKSRKDSIIAYIVEHVAGPGY